MSSSGEDVLIYVLVVLEPINLPFGMAEGRILHNLTCDIQ